MRLSSNINKNISIYYLLTIFIFTQTGCKKLVDVNAPVTSSNADIVYSTDATAIAVLNGVYIKMSQSGITNGITSTSLFTGLSSDELRLFDGVTDPTYVGYYQNSLTSSNTSGMDFWISIYSSYVFVANSAIEGLNKSSGLTPAVKQQLLGEAKFIRAFCYFYLVNLYGDVPLVLTTDYRINSNIPRSAKADVYKQILLDLVDSKELLNENYLDITLLSTSSERVTPNKWTATALLSRSYLYNNDWVHAEEQATSIINNTNLYDTVPLSDVFLKNNKEAIWQLQPVDNVVSNTSDARLFVLPVTGPNTYQNMVYLSDYLKKSFETGDNRKTTWTDSITTENGITYAYPAKYKNNEIFSPVTEYTVIFRLAEQYLIRAEARAEQGNIEGATSDLNIIRQRAGLSPTTASTQPDLLTAILKERQVELFTEWGNRWFDLKRMGKADEVLKPIKRSSWQSTDQLYPIPQTEIDKNISLKGHQNQGYN